MAFLGLASVMKPAISMSANLDRRLRAAAVLSILLRMQSGLYSAEHSRPVVWKSLLKTENFVFFRKERAASL